MVNGPRAFIRFNQYTFERILFCRKKEKAKRATNKTERMLEKILVSIYLVFFSLFEYAPVECACICICVFGYCSTKKDYLAALIDIDNKRSDTTIKIEMLACVR